MSGLQLPARLDNDSARSSCVRPFAVVQLFKEIMLSPDSAPMALTADHQGGGGADGGGSVASMAMGGTGRSAVGGADDDGLLARWAGRGQRGGGGLAITRVSIHAYMSLTLSPCHAPPLAAACVCVLSCVDAGAANGSTCRPPPFSSLVCTRLLQYGEPVQPAVRRDAPGPGRQPGGAEPAAAALRLLGTTF